LVPPSYIVCELGATVSEKSGVRTTSVTVAVWESVPLIPLIVRVYVPGDVELEVATVRVEFPELLIEVGLNVPVVEVGKPVTLRATAPENPLREEMLTV
jgi:hypothetical protein